MTEDGKTFKLIIKYDKQFEEQVESGDPNPLADITIRVGEYDLTGASDGQFYLDDYMFFNLRKQLGAVKEVLDGETRELTFYSIPDDLVLDPNDDTVFVSLLNSHGERKNDSVPEGGVPVSKEAFVVGLVDAAEEFREQVISINPSLKNSEQMQALGGHIDKAKQMLSEWSKEK